MKHFTLFDFLLASIHVTLTWVILIRLVPFLMPYHFISCSSYKTDATEMMLSVEMQRDIQGADEANAITLLKATAVHFTLAFITFPLVRYIVKAPYGKHAPESLSKYLTLPAWLSWIVQESPTLLNILFFMLIEYPAHILPYASCNCVTSAPSSSSSLSLPSSTSSDVNFNNFTMQPLSSLYHTFNWMQYTHAVKEGALRCKWYMILFAIHYIHRSLIYPFRLSANARRVPLPVTWSATLYCLFNGRLQLLASITPWYAFWDNKQSIINLWYSTSPYISLNVFLMVTIVGFCLFAAGLWLNIMVDNYLLSLKAKTSEYVIPMHWSFRYVSCPNFTAEIVEWIGFTLIVCASTYVTYTESMQVNMGYNNNNYYHGKHYKNWYLAVWEVDDAVLPALTALSFVIYVLANLIPRAIAHHEWYIQKFGDKYRQLHRRAIIPYVL